MLITDLLGSEAICLVFFLADREERRKGQTQDDTVEIGVGGREWLRDVAKATSETRRGPPTLFNISLPALQRFFTFGLELIWLDLPWLHTALLAARRCFGGRPHGL